MIGFCGDYSRWKNEVVPERDVEFFESMNLKNCWGNGEFLFLCVYTKCCADRDNELMHVTI